MTAPETSPHFDLRKTYMSDRGLLDYFDRLELSEEELNDPQSIILDLGAGTQQNFAREARELGLNVKKIISIDPRLGLSEEDDLSIPATEKQKRVKGRKSAESLTVAALADALPFADESMTKIYAMYSVPYYLENPAEMEKSMREMIRVLKKDGVIRAYPVLKEQKEVLEDLLKNFSGIDHSFKLKEKEEEDEDWLLVIVKTGAVH